LELRLWYYGDRKTYSHLRASIMHIPRIVFTFAIAVLSIVQVGSGLQAQESAPQLRSAAHSNPNILVFIADDMAAEDCGAYGHPKIRTPNIDRLAREGMRFTRAFLTCSSCSPSRSSILTSRYPHNTGAEQLHWPLPADRIMVSAILHEAGYWTAAVGKWHLGEAVRRQFEKTVPRFDDTLATLRNRPRDRPFFVWAASTDPHRPYQPGAIPTAHVVGDAVVPPYLPDVAEVREDLALYYDEIARLDGAVGDVRDELERQGVLDDTCIVFISDNGRPFPRCKTTIYDSGIRTPLIVRYPRLVKAGTVCNSLVSSIDLSPTFVEIAKSKSPEPFQGRSFLPLLKDPEAPAVRMFAFAEHNWHDFDDHSRAVRSQRFKYIRNWYTDVAGTPPADAVRSPSFQAMRRLRDANKLNEAQLNPFRKPRPGEELYDVEADPHELVNLVDDGRYADELKQLRQALDEWMRETGDGVPAERTPDEFDRETGERLTERAPDAGRKPRPNQASRRPATAD
jgi:arylsulfatase A-like enzyme